MEKADIVRALRRASDQQGFITLKELMEAFGKKERRSVLKYVDGLEAVNGKYYLITDVAAVIKSMCRVA